MVPSEDYVKKIIRIGKLRGQDRSCPYYPCHGRLYDCTWCFCPFYPCYDASLGGKWVKNSQTGEFVWSCEGCDWVHDVKVAERLLTELKQLQDEAFGRRYYAELSRIKLSLLAEGKEDARKR